MKRLCIIPCGSSKIWDKYPELGGVEAQNVYIGSFAKKCRQYAELFFSDWVILSAKHGFLFPNDIVPDNYNASFNSPNEEVITLGQLKKQKEYKSLESYDEIFVLGGKKYVEIVQKTFGEEKDYRLPLKGCKGIGYMIQKLNNAIKEQIEISVNNIFE